MLCSETSPTTGSQAFIVLPFLVMDLSRFQTPPLGDGPPQVSHSPPRGWTTPGASEPPGTGGSPARAPGLGTSGRWQGRHRGSEAEARRDQRNTAGSTVSPTGDEKEQTCLLLRFAPRPSGRKPLLTPPAHPHPDCGHLAGAHWAQGPWSARLCPRTSC